MKRFNSKKGFTLIEALVAVSILMVAVAAPITIAQKGLSSAVYSKDQMIASYLAQDAIEYVINQRDQASINNPAFDWGEFKIDFDICTDEAGCEIDTVDPFDSFLHIRARVGEGEFIKKSFDSDGEFEFYGYNGTEDTKFLRKINMDFHEINNVEGLKNEALITAEVTWPGGDGNNHVTIHTLIYNR